MSEPEVLPLAYHITFNCYGARLPGCEAGTVKRNDYNIHGTDKIPPNPGWELCAMDQMSRESYFLDRRRQRIVLAAIMEVCRFRKWTLYAAHIRSNHIHIVVQADKEPERVMVDFKAYASRRLNETGLDP
jgi:hypothetical protein